jgi:hypothetical protein
MAAMIRVFAACLMVAALAEPSSSGTVRDAAAAAASQQESGKISEADRPLSPEEKMRRRFPQPVRVGDLVGLPVLDWRDSTIGYIRQVVRTPDGKIQLVVPYGRWLGWLKGGGALDRYRRPVGVPIETVAILGRQVAALDMPREEFDSAPVVSAAATALGPNEMIQIALGRR